MADAQPLMRQALALTLGFGLLFLVLVLPNHPGTLKWTALNRFPLELPVLIFGCMALGRRWWLPVLLALVLLTTTFLKLADFGMFTAYNRTFNPILDAFLIDAGLGLLRTSIGTPLTILAAIAALLALMALFFALLTSFQAWSRVNLTRPLRLCAALVSLIFAGWSVADTGHSLKYWKLAKNPPGSAWTSRLAFKRALEMRATSADLIAFAGAAKNDPYDKATGLFDRIAGRNVIFIFIESYGRASFDNPLYADLHPQTLRSFEPMIMEAGFDIKSGWMTSPTAGGQSWLAHGALASGMWTNHNGRYTAMLGSGKKWLFHFAQEAGFRTAAIMPAITIAWPESSKMGFELIFPARDIPYKGKRFNWVTMPDQFTLGVYRELLPEDPRSDFLQIALISSHAPWVPIPDMVAWEDLGDGTIFNEMARKGPTPRKLWRNYDNVRAQYRLAVDYALQATFSHVARLEAEAPLIFVIGDHQAAQFVAGSENKDVPMHVIAPREVMALMDHWQLSDGLVPKATAPVWRMDTFRNRFIETFTTPQRLPKGAT